MGSYQKKQGVCDKGDITTADGGHGSQGGSQGLAQSGFHSALGHRFQDEAEPADLLTLILLHQSVASPVSEHFSTWSRLHGAQAENWNFPFLPHQRDDLSSLF
jgi:hypothetical protein